MSDGDKGAFYRLGAGGEDRGQGVCATGRGGAAGGKPDDG